MGLLLDRLKQFELGPESEVTNNNYENSKGEEDEFFDNSSKINTKSLKCHTEFQFPDLEAMPPELSLQILKNLNATDLCLAACVWSSLANDDILWQSLCKSTWGHATIYYKASENGSQSKTLRMNFRYIFMHLDEATLTFNADWKKGLDYLFQRKLLENDSMEIAKFVNSTNKLSSIQKEKLFNEKKPVLENIIKLHNYENQFLPTALRQFFSKIEAPKERNSYLSLILEKFSKRFCSCNPQDLNNLNEDTVYIICFSLILLSVDLTSPHVKNKMSKREFIKNTRNALPNLNPDFTGHLYDNIYLNGNIAKSSARLSRDQLTTVR